MCEPALCLELKKCLDAAFRGEMEETEPLRAWASTFMDALRNRFPGGSPPETLVWYVADRVLQSFFLKCPCEGLVESILHKPEAFLRSVLLAAGLPLSKKEGPLQVFSLQ